MLFFADRVGCLRGMIFPLHQIELPFARTCELMAQCAWDELLANDQLGKERSTNRVFYGFSEAPSLFPPSYR